MLELKFRIRPFNPEEFYQKVETVKSNGIDLISWNVKMEGEFPETGGGLVRRVINSLPGLHWHIGFKGSDETNHEYLEHMVAEGNLYSNDKKFFLQRGQTILHFNIDELDSSQIITQPVTVLGYKVTDLIATEEIHLPKVNVNVKNYDLTYIAYTRFKKSRALEGASKFKSRPQYISVPK